MVEGELLKSCFTPPGSPASSKFGEEKRERWSHSKAYETALQAITLVKDAYTDNVVLSYSLFTFLPILPLDLRLSHLSHSLTPHSLPPGTVSLVLEHETRKSNQSTEHTYNTYFSVSRLVLVIILV